MKTIPLSRGLFAIVDDDDFEKINHHKWYAYQNPTGSFYAVRSVRTPIRRTIYMHREILGAPEGVEVDHKYGNTLDNRKEVIRLATTSQNHWNMRRRAVYAKRPVSSSFKGVCWHKRLGRWQVRVGYKNKRLFVGQFQSEKDAALAYDRKARELFGEFARTNFKEVG